MKLSYLLHGGILVLIAALVMGLTPVLAVADDDDHASAEPSTFVGAAGDCGPGYPAGSRIVTARWLKGMGLPDNGGQNVGTNPADNPNKKDQHWGLLLSKNGTTPDCSSAGARIHGVKGMKVTATTALGFDYRNGGHCGAGAPRFNVDTDMGFFFRRLRQRAPEPGAPGSAPVDPDPLGAVVVRHRVLPRPDPRRGQDQEHHDHLRRGDGHRQQRHPGRGSGRPRQHLRQRRGDRRHRQQRRRRLN